MIESCTTTIGTSNNRIKFSKKPESKSAHWHSAMSRRHEFPFQIISASTIRDCLQNPHITINNAHYILSNTIIFISNDTGCFMFVRIIQDNCLTSIVPVTIAKNTRCISSSPDDRHSGRGRNVCDPPHLHPALTKNSLCPLT